VDQDTLESRLRARTGITDDIVSENDLRSIILSCLDEYNRRRPSLVLTLSADAILTVADQPNYAIPANALWVVEVAWNPFDIVDDDTTGTLEAFLEQTYLAALRSDKPSEVVAYRQGMAKWAELFKGHWRIINNGTADEIWLDPVPTSNNDYVAVYYVAARDINGLGWEKDHQFFHLCKAALKERWGMELVKVSGRAGAYSFPASAAQMILKDARSEYDRVLLRISRSHFISRGASGSFIRSNP